MSSVWIHLYPKKNCKFCKTAYNFSLLIEYNKRLGSKPKKVFWQSLQYAPGVSKEKSNYALYLGHWQHNLIWTVFHQQKTNWKYTLSFEIKRKKIFLVQSNDQLSFNILPQNIKYKIFRKKGKRPQDIFSGYN